MAKAILRKTRETRVRGGHPWIYASEIESTEGSGVCISIRIPFSSEEEG